MWSAASRTSLIKRQISGKIVLLRVSNPKANTLNICYDVFLRNCHDFQEAYVTVVMNKLTYVLFHKVGWETQIRLWFSALAYINLIDWLSDWLKWRAQETSVRLNTIKA